MLSVTIIFAVLALGGAGAFIVYSLAGDLGPHLVKIKSMLRVKRV